MQIPSIIANHTNIKNEKLWHFYLLLGSWASINTVMNVSVVLFLNESLNSIFLAGLALSIGSVFSMLFDGLFSALQKSFPARTLFLASIVGIMIAIFFFLISIHPVLAFIAAIFFRVSFDLYDITAMSYILGRSTPDGYGENLSYKQLAQGLGMIFGLVLSAVLLGAAYFIGDTANAVADKITDAQIDQFFSSLFLLKLFLVALLVILFLIAYILFDTEGTKVNKSALFIAARELKTSGIEKIRNAKKKIFHPFHKKEKREKEQKKMTAKEVFNELTGSMKDIKKVLFAKPRQISLLWAMGIMGIFSYWDTFLATFLPIFFTEVLRAQDGWLQNIPGSLLLLVFILPVLGFLPIVAKMGDKYGRYYFMMAGIFITAIASLVAGFASIESFGILMAAGFAIAFGYLFGMSSGKAQAASTLNTFLKSSSKKEEKDDFPLFADEINKTERKEDNDMNASAGPIMLVDNMGNIIGPALGGLMIDAIEFQGFFILFGFLLLLLFGWSAWKWKIIKV